MSVEPRWRQVRLEHQEGDLRDASAQSSQVRHRYLLVQEAGRGEAELHRVVLRHGQLLLVHVNQVLTYLFSIYLSLPESYAVKPRDH